jgi:hypothetical protein
VREEDKERDADDVGMGESHRPPIDGVLEACREDVRAIHARAAGLRQHYVLVDRRMGWIEVIGVWDSADDLAGRARARAGKTAPVEGFGTNPPVGVFEVADELR